MSYVGKEPTFGSYPSQLLSGNGVLTSFTLTHGAATPAALIVSIDGVKQNVTAYGVTGTTIDFGAGNAPPSGTDNIEIIYLFNVSCEDNFCTFACPSNNCFKFMNR